MDTFPGNGIFVVQGEVSHLITSMKKTHWSLKAYQEECNKPLMKTIFDLKHRLNEIDDLRKITPDSYIGPFLDVIRSTETTVPVTVLALSSINKFISYRLIDGTNANLLPLIKNIADAVAHANFVSSDHPSDSVILMKIVQVLLNIVKSPLGVLLTNDSVCEIMLSCFKICFETRLNESLRATAENSLREIVQLLLTRLPTFAESNSQSTPFRKMSMRSKTMEGNNKSSIESNVNKVSDFQSEDVFKEKISSEQSAQTTDVTDSKQDEYEIVQRPQDSSVNESVTVTYDSAPVENCATVAESGAEIYKDSALDDNKSVEELSVAVSTAVNFDNDGVQGETSVTEESGHDAANDAGDASLEPYNVLCIQELLRFLSLICNPFDKQNTEVMIHTSLSLLVISLEIGAESIRNHASLVNIVKDVMTRNLLALLSAEKIQIFSEALRVSFLVYYSMRDLLKFQFQYYLSSLCEMIPEQSKVSYQKKELALECLSRLWNIPGLVTELFVNYDCDLYCPNLYKEITKLLSRNVYPVGGIGNSNLMSLDTLLSIVTNIERNCQRRISNDLDGKYHKRTSRAILASPPSKSAQNVGPSHEELMAIKRKKKLLSTGTQHFNLNAKKGIAFMQEHGLLSTPLDCNEVVSFLRENPHLDKKTIGDFISHRSNAEILECFVRSFDFSYMRVDEALRIYLESFRLPGESPLISAVLQHFADHWHVCNGEPFSKSDSAFILAYAVIMLNVDQHNQVAKRQTVPMTIEDFKKNLKGVDSGRDFDQQMLQDIYNSIKTEEIVMPEEHTGMVKLNYTWKVLLRRGAGKDGTYIKVNDGIYDHELFAVGWAPAVSALSYIFEKSDNPDEYEKCVKGFEKCATISAHYGMCNEFDSLILTLLKFTTILNCPANTEQFTVSFGTNVKALLATEITFNLVLKYGDVLREGWQAICVCLYNLFRCKLLPSALNEGDDFLEVGGKICLLRAEPIREKSAEGILSSLYSYITLGSDSSSQRLSAEGEKKYIDIAKCCVADCNLEKFIKDCKFLRMESLYELLQSLIVQCYDASGAVVMDNKQDEDKIAFCMETLVKVTVENKERAVYFWQRVADHIIKVLVAASNQDRIFVIERCVIGLLKIAQHLSRQDNEEISSAVLQSLQNIFKLSWRELSLVHRQISFGLYELIKMIATNTLSEEDWILIFVLLEVVGAGTPLPLLDCAQDTNLKADHEGTGEDSGIGIDKQALSGSDTSLNSVTSSRMTVHSWTLGDRNRPLYTSDFLLPHDPVALVKCCESLAYMIRDTGYINSVNFEVCIRCLRTFVEATARTSEKIVSKKNAAYVKTKKGKKVPEKSKSNWAKGHKNGYDADESDPEEYPDSYSQMPLQLLDLMHLLHTRLASFCCSKEENKESWSLWSRGWRPLLQGMARLCCDSRKQVRTSAITYLQRALLMPDLQKLGADEWESCFKLVLFPLMDRLSAPVNPRDLIGVEETRTRAATLLSKIFLHHLTPLQSLPSFKKLWMKILDIMDTYMNLEKGCDILNEAARESLKNMLLVMESSQFLEFEDCDAFWKMTWERVDKFLPNLRDEVHRYLTENEPQNELSQEPAPKNLNNARNEEIILSPTFLAYNMAQERLNVATCVDNVSSAHQFNVAPRVEALDVCHSNANVCVDNAGAHSLNVTPCADARANAESSYNNVYETSIPTEKTSLFKSVEYPSLLPSFRPLQQGMGANKASSGFPSMNRNENENDRVSHDSVPISNDGRVNISQNNGHLSGNEGRILCQIEGHSSFQNDGQGSIFLKDDRILSQNEGRGSILQIEACVPPRNNSSLPSLNEGRRSIYQNDCVIPSQNEGPENVPQNDGPIPSQNENRGGVFQNDRRIPSQNYAHLQCQNGGPGSVFQNDGGVTSQGHVHLPSLNEVPGTVFQNDGRVTSRIHGHLPSQSEGPGTIFQNDDRIPSPSHGHLPFQNEGPKSVIQNDDRVTSRIHGHLPSQSEGPGTIFQNDDRMPSPSHGHLPFQNEGPKSVIQNDGRVKSQNNGETNIYHPAQSPYAYVLPQMNEPMASGFKIEGLNLYSESKYSSLPEEGKNQNYVNLVSGGNLASPKMEMYHYYPQHAEMPTSLNHASSSSEIQEQFNGQWNLSQSVYDENQRRFSSVPVSPTIPGKVIPVNLTEDANPFFNNPSQLRDNSNASRFFDQL